MWTREPATLVAVDVTFLRMDRPPNWPAPRLEPPLVVERLQPRCPVARYRRLYDGVGHDYVWWLRRTLDDEELDALLDDPAISIHVLHDGGRELGFYELDRRGWPNTNLSYFGLMPEAIGRGLGMALLRHAIRTAWDEGCFTMTVNTCTADHPRALPNYVKAGFRILRSLREEWPIPDRLGLPIPERLRV